MKKRIIGPPHRADAAAPASRPDIGASASPDNTAPGARSANRHERRKREKEFIAFYDAVNRTGVLHVRVELGFNRSHVKRPVECLTCRASITNPFGEIRARALGLDDGYPSLIWPLCIACFTGDRRDQLIHDAVKRIWPFVNEINAPMDGPETRQ